MKPVRSGPPCPGAAWLTPPAGTGATRVASLRALRQTTVVDVRLVQDVVASACDPDQRLAQEAAEFLDNMRPADARQVSLLVRLLPAPHCAPFLYQPLLTYCTQMVR